MVVYVQAPVISVKVCFELILQRVKSKEATELPNQASENANEVNELSSVLESTNGTTELQGLSTESNTSNLESKLIVNTTEESSEATELSNQASVNQLRRTSRTHNQPSRLQLDPNSKSYALAAMSMEPECPETIEIDGKKQ
jgi:hypothetical protein